MKQKSNNSLRAPLVLWAIFALLTFVSTGNFASVLAAPTPATLTITGGTRTLVHPTTTLAFNATASAAVGTSSPLTWPATTASGLYIDNLLSTATAGTVLASFSPWATWTGSMWLRSTATSLTTLAGTTAVAAQYAVGMTAATPTALTTTTQTLLTLNPTFNTMGRYALPLSFQVIDIPAFAAVSGATGTVTFTYQ